MKILRASIIAAVCFLSSSLVIGENRIPLPLEQPEPEYPVWVKRRKIAGTVVVSFIVTTKGEVVDAKVIESPHPELSELALAAVRKWRFTPPMKDGRLVNARLKQRLDFVLGPEKQESGEEEKKGEPGATDNPDDAQRI